MPVQRTYNQPARLNPNTGLWGSVDNTGDPRIVITGTVGQGLPLNVRAVGFNFELPSSEPAIYEDFYGATNGQILYDHDNSWTKYASGGALVTNRNPRYSGHLSAYNGAERGQFHTNYKFFTGGRKVLVSYWCRTDNADYQVGGVSGGDYAIIKWARLGSVDGGGGIYNGKGMHTISNQQPQVAGDPYALFRNSAGAEVNLGYIAMPWNEWVRVEMHIYMSDAGVPNGYYNVYLSTGDTKISTGLMQRDVGDTHTIGSFLLGLELANYDNRISYQVVSVNQNQDYSVTYLGTTYAINSGSSPSEASIVNALAAAVNADTGAAVGAFVSPANRINLRLKSTTFSPNQGDFSFSSNFTRHYFGLQNSEIFVQTGSFARFVIGDAATWDACSEASKEIQSYSMATSETVVLKQNHAAISGAKFLYYIKDDNTPQFSDGVALV